MYQIAVMKPAQCIANHFGYFFLFCTLSFQILERVPSAVVPFNKVAFTVRPGISSRKIRNFGLSTEYTAGTCTPAVLARNSALASYHIMPSTETYSLDSLGVQPLIQSWVTIGFGKSLFHNSRSTVNVVRKVIHTLGMHKWHTYYTPLPHLAK